MLYYNATVRKLFYVQAFAYKHFKNSFLIFIRDD